MQHHFSLPVDTLFNYIQYFFGFLLVDLYLSEIKFKFPVWASFIIGLLCLLFIGYADLRARNYLEYIFPIVALGFYLLVLTDSLWRKVFSLRYITAIGGMCYSIYLLHYNIIPVLGNTTIKFNLFQSYPLTYFWHALILIVPIVLFSGIFYLLIERPCMDKDWPTKFWFAVKRFFGPKPLPPSTAE